jgi:hypothetical protein
LAAPIKQIIKHTTIYANKNTYIAGAPDSGLAGLYGQPMANHGAFQCILAPGEWGPLVPMLADVKPEPNMKLLDPAQEKRRAQWRREGQRKREKARAEKAMQGVLESMPSNPDSILALQGMDLHDLQLMWRHVSDRIDRIEEGKRLSSELIFELECVQESHLQVP